MIQPSDRPVTEDEMVEWEQNGTHTKDSEFVERLIAAVREARSISLRHRVRADKAEAKLIEIRAVVKSLSPFDLKHVTTLTLERLHEVICE
jgi:hypothetical protein